MVYINFIYAVPMGGYMGNRTTVTVSSDVNAILQGLKYDLRCRSKNDVIEKLVAMYFERGS